MNEPYTSFTVAQATQKLEYFCSYQDRCHNEVIQKLKSLNMIPLAIDTIIAHLIEHNFLNEERFACSFARGKFRIKNWGRRRIIQELKFKGITKYNIDRALKEITEEEYIEAFNILAGRQWEASRESNILIKKKKLTGYLLRKGFENQLVFNKIDDLASL